jgi:micrococcal nuclease
MKPEYKYSALVIKVIDGDTIDCVVDLGFSIFSKIRFRLHGIDTPEKSSKIVETKELAYKATEFVRSTVENKDVTIESFGKDKYGRWLGKIYISPSEPSLNEQLVSLGLAKSYFGDNKANLWETQ